MRKQFTGKELEELRFAIPHLLWIVGLLPLLIGIFLDAVASVLSIDSTPDQFADMQRSHREATLLITVGALLFISGIIWIICRRILARRSRLVWGRENL